MAKITFSALEEKKDAAFYKDTEGDLWIKLNDGWAVLSLIDGKICDWLYFDSDEQFTLTPFEGRIIIDA